MPELEGIRTEAESLVRELDWEVYQNWAGLKEDLDTAAIYRKHAGLFSPEVLHQIRTLRRAESDEEDLRRFTFLEGLLLSTFLENQVRDLSDRHATEEARREIVVNGTTLPFRMSAVKLSNEADRTLRQKIFQARNQAIEEMNAILVARWERLHTLARDLGYKDYQHLFSEIKGIDFAHLEGMMSVFLDRTEGLYRSHMEPRLRSMGLHLPEAEKHDVALLFRGKAWDALFPKEQTVAVLRSTLLDLGFDLEKQTNIELDTTERPTKSPRAFCVPESVPDHVLLVTMPHGGHDDYATILHEAGHAEHFANVDRDLPFEYKYLGDNSVTEGMAFCLEYITLSPVWLKEKVGMSDPGEFLRFVYAYKLYFLRRYAGKLRYEMLLHSRGLNGMGSIYKRELERVLTFQHPESHYLVDLDDGFYAAQYLRAWILEAQLSQYLQETYGDAWFKRNEAGVFLQDLWSQGQKFRAEELAVELGYSGLDINPLLDQIQWHLSP